MDIVLIFWILFVSVIILTIVAVFEALVILLSQGWAWNMFKKRIFKYKGGAFFCILRKNGTFQVKYKLIPKDKKFKFGKDKTNEVHLIAPSHYDDGGNPWFIIVEGNPANVHLHKMFAPSEMARMLGSIALRLYSLGKMEGRQLSQQQEKIILVLFIMGILTLVAAFFAAWFAFSNNAILTTIVDDAVAKLTEAVTEFLANNPQFTGTGTITPGSG